MDYRKKREANMVSSTPLTPSKFKSKSACDILSRLDQYQRAAAMHGRGPALVIAGPGSGKTTLLVARTARLVEIEGVNPDDILSLTFSRAAGEEMAKRYISLTSTMGPRFNTIHAFCLSLVRAAKDGRTLVEAVPDRRYKILHEIYRKINGFAPDKMTVDIMSGEIGYIVNRMLDINPVLCGYSGKTRNLRKIFQEYIEYKKKMNLLDFDDLQKTALSLLSNRWGESTIKDLPPENPVHKDPSRKNSKNCTVRYKYKYLQIDEGQDLSPLQFKIISLLSDNSSSIFMMADDDQSIYGFRGADPANISRFINNYPELKTYRIIMNYRSISSIVSLSSTFIKNNFARIEKTYESAASNNQTAECDILPVICKKGGRNEQAGEIAEIILSFKNPSSKYSSLSSAIIYRNNISAIIYAYHLLKRKIPFNITNDCNEFFSHWLLGDIKNRLNNFINKKRPGRLIRKMWETGGLREKCRDTCFKRGLSASFANGVYENTLLLAENLETASDFLTELDAAENAFKSSVNSDASLTLTTAHSSKGLEFDNVFMVDLIEGEFPSADALSALKLQGKREAVEEERRLFYVGITRARKKLYLYSPKNNTRYDNASSFVSEIEKIYGKQGINKL